MIFKSKNIFFIILFSFSIVSEASQKGIASWYGSENTISSSGKRLHKHQPAAAHKHLPIGSQVKVTSIKTKKSIVVVIEDRGPYTKNRIIDLNYIAAKQLGIINKGLDTVIIEKL